MGVVEGPEDDFPLPEELPRRSSSNTVIFVVVACIVGGVVLVGILAGLVVVLIPKSQVRVHQLQDTNDLREIAGFIVSAESDVPIARDGRIDVYAFLRREGVDRQAILDICRSDRTGKGPSWAEVEAGDCTNFPYQRHRGALDPESPVAVPVVWDREATKGQRFAAFSDGSAGSRDEATFREFFRSNPGQE